MLTLHLWNMEDHRSNDQRDNSEWKIYVEDPAPSGDTEYFSAI